MISRIRHAWTYLSAYALTTAFVLIPTVTLLAQEAGGEEEEAGPSWVLNYILVSLFVVLGVMVVCYGSNRQNEELRLKELREMQEKNKAG